ncbi:MAG: hypothetical protein AAFP23_07830 [Pseudomonadota bacterium]
MAYHAKDRLFAAPPPAILGGLLGWIERLEQRVALGQAAAKAWERDIELSLTREERAEDLRRRFFGI